MAPEIFADVDLEALEKSGVEIIKRERKADGWRVSEIKILNCNACQIFPWAKACYDNTTVHLGEHVYDGDGYYHLDFKDWARLKNLPKIICLDRLRAPTILSLSIGTVWPLDSEIIEPKAVFVRWNGQIEQSRGKWLVANPGDVRLFNEDNVPEWARSKAQWRTLRPSDPKMRVKTGYYFPETTSDASEITMDKFLAHMKADMSITRELPAGWISCPKAEIPALLAWCDKLDAGWLPVDVLCTNLGLHHGDRVKKALEPFACIPPSSPKLEILYPPFTFAEILENGLLMELWGICAIGCEGFLTRCLMNDEARSKILAGLIAR